MPLLKVDMIDKINNYDTINYNEEELEIINNKKQEYERELKETLEIMEKNYADKFKESNYFSAVNKATMFSYVVGRKSNGKISL